ncbi:MAG: DUF4465 domain-containing protein [Bacteroidota bacterium]
MKTRSLLIAFAATVLFFFSSCEKDQTEKDKITFEEIELNAEGVYIDKSGGFTSGNAFFPTDYNASWDSWAGFVVTNHSDTETRGYENQYSAIAGSGASGSEKYSVLYTMLKDTLELLVPEKITNISVCNSTYAYYAMLEGNDFSKQFGGDSGDEPDYFNLIIEALDESGRSVMEATITLADYRFTNNAEDYISNTWNDVDLGEAGYLKYLVFSFESSDMGDFGINTPTYICIDNISGELLD